MREVLAGFTELVHNITAGQGFVMVEALSEDLSIEDMMLFYNCSDFPFNFNLILDVEAGPDGLSGVAVRDAVASWLDNLPPGKATVNNLLMWSAESLWAGLIVG